MDSEVNIDNNRRQKCPELLENMLCVYGSMIFLRVQGTYRFLYILFISYSLFRTPHGRSGIGLWQKAEKEKSIRTPDD